jgi:hypothetical protein
MPGKTGINWTNLSWGLGLLSKVPDTIGFMMFPRMAGFAKGYAVRNIKPKFREESERFDMMGVKVPAARIAATDAFIAVSGENLPPPFGILGRFTQRSFFDGTAFPSVMLRTARRGFLSGVANLLPFGGGSLLPGPAFIPEFPSGYDVFVRLPGYLLSFIRGRSPLEGFLLGNAGAIEAFIGEPVGTGFVFAEGLSILPKFTFRTSFSPGFDMGDVFF